MKVLGIAGSLRQASLSRLLLTEASLHAPPDMHLRSFALDEIPVYNGDHDTDDLRPASVRAFIDAIRESDALLIVTPEYNYSIPGVLKNAIDWASRPAYRSVLAGKTTAMVGLSVGAAGGARALTHLKDVLLGVLARPLPVPDVLVPGAKNVIDANGRLSDDAVKERLTRLLAGLSDEVRVQQAALRARTPGS
jgi:chromate reductase